MKKILSILFFCFFAASSYAQSNLFPTLDSLQNYIYRYVRNSTVQSFTNLRLQNSLIGLSQLIDSLAGNGAIDSIWLTGGSPDTLKYRLAGVTITVGTISGGGGSSYTFTNGLTESAGTVRLGGTLTQNTSIAGGGFSMNISNLSSGTITAASVTEQAQLALATNNPSFNYTGLTSGRFHNLSADSDGWGISATRTGASTFFSIAPDSIAFRPHLGQIFIDTVASVGVVDTTSNKVLVYNTGTKRMQRMSWPASGVSYTLINGANNLGSGSQVFKDTSSNKINLRSLTAGWGLDVTQNANDIEYKADTAQLATSTALRDTAQRLDTRITAIASVDTLLLTDSINLVAFGDSYTQNLNASPSSLGYIELLSDSNRALLNNQSVSARGVWEMAKRGNLNSVLPVNNVNVVTSLTGLNDVRRNGSATKTINKIKYAYESVIANSFKSNSIVNAGNAAVTRSGSWSSYAANALGGKYGSSGTLANDAAFTSSLNGYAEWTFTASAVVVQLMGNSGDVETYAQSVEISIDGVPIDTVNTNDAWDNVSDGSYDNRRGPQPFVYMGLTNASHTIRVKNLTTDFLAVDFFATLQTPAACLPVIIGQIPYLSADGYAISPSSGSVAATDIANDTLESIVDRFASYGYPVYLARTNDYWDTTNLDTDDIHPTNAGHQQIFEAFDAVLNVTTPSPTVTINGTTILMAVQYAVNAAVSSSANYTVDIDDYYIELPDLTATASNRVINLPTSYGVGRTLIIKNKNSSATYSWSSSQTLKDNTDSNITTLTNDKVYHIIWNGTNWIITMLY